MNLRSQLDTILPQSLVLATAKEFLEECRWQLEIDERVVTIPPDTDLYVRSRAFITGDAPDVFIGDHYEATVLLGYEESRNNIDALYGILRLYFNLDRKFVSEDRFGPKG